MSWFLLTYLGRRGVDVGAFLAKEGFDVQRLFAPDSRMRLAELHNPWRAASHALGDDELLGIRIASQIDPLATLSWSMPFSLLEAVQRVSGSLRDANESDRFYGSCAMASRS